MARGSPRIRTADDKVNQVGQRVHQRRTVLKLTQEELVGRLAAETGGMWNGHRMEIYRIEIGTRIVSDLELIALARALECDPVWLFLGTSGSNSATSSKP